jgi:N-acetylmuramoyl-L-alanine amidase
MSFLPRLILAALALIATPAMAQEDPASRTLDDVMAQVAAHPDAVATVQAHLPRLINADQDAANFASLDEAIAAQPRDLALDDEARCLAGAIYFESKGEPLTGQLAVADVILNRIKSGRFPRTICSVVTQPGQFSFVRAGRVPEIADCAYYRTAIAVARVAMTEAWQSPAHDALFFHARRIAPGWHREHIATIGNQVFYR